MPLFYANTIENIRAKDDGYDDVVRKLREYIYNRQTKIAKKRPMAYKLTEKERDRKSCGYVYIVELRVGGVLVIRKVNVSLNGVRCVNNEKNKEQRKEQK